MLSNLAKNHQQQDLFSVNQNNQLAAMSRQKSNAIKDINKKFNESIKYASEVGNDKWLPKANFRSKRYTTSWSELLAI